MLLTDECFGAIYAITNHQVTESRKIKIVQSPRLLPWQNYNVDYQHLRQSYRHSESYDIYHISYSHFSLGK